MPTHPNPAAEAHERNVRLILAWIAQYRDAPLLTPEDFLTPLQTLQQTPLPPHQAMALADLLFACLETRLDGFRAAFANVAIPLARQQRQEVHALQDVLENFALAYAGIESALSETGTPDEARPSCLERATFCLYEHIYLSHLVAAPPRLGIWQHLHQLFLRARTQQITLPAYGAALLLAAAQPSAFSARELAFIAGLIRRYGADLEISTAIPEVPHGTFWIDPSRDHPAFALARRTPPPDCRVFYFSCRTLADEVAAKLQALTVGVAPAQLGLDEFADTPAGKGALRRLASFWGKPGRRRFPRRRQSERATVCTGLTRIWRLLQAPEKLDDTDFSEWMITNQSPDGYALMHLRGKAGRLRIGDLVALRPETKGGETARWLIGLVRWALSENPEHIEIGLQILAPHATPATLAQPDAATGKVETAALILPELPPLRPQPVLVVPSGRISGLERSLVLLVEKDNLEIRHVRPRDIQEQNGRVEMFTLVPAVS
jgi:hypothetical protein